jgi:hypothetical protein
MKHQKSLSLFFFLLPVLICAQDTDRKIQFPDVDGYLTLKTDFHIHTIFSDGHVYPTIRIQEAVRDGLDAISLTEHIEYQPWAEDVPHPDRNRSFEIAKEIAKPHNLIIIHGTEITRDMPPGHANALFVKDVNEIMDEDAMTSYKKARAQGAFIFWNHPNWINQQKDALPRVSAFHEELIKNDLLHGIEVVNDLTFSDEALKIALERGLTVMGTSDIHGLVDYQFRLAEGGHRPICLVFAKERNEESIKEALFAGRTVTWFDNILSGKEENIAMLVEASLELKVKDYIGDSEVLEVELVNSSDATFVLKNKSIYDFHRNIDLVEVEPHSSKTLQIITSRSDGMLVPLKFEVLNAVVGYKQNFEVQFPLKK